MIIPLVLAVASTSVVVFLAGYRLAMYHHKMQFIHLNDEGDSLEPIFTALDREYAYTEELTKPFTDDK
jgi:hypothetical protein